MQTTNMVDENIKRIGELFPVSCTRSLTYSPITMGRQT